MTGLVLERFGVEAVRPGAPTRLEGGCLTLDADAVAAVVREAAGAITSVRVGIAAPGDAARVVCVKDVVQPRVKRRGAQAGEGVTAVLDGVAVVTCGPIVGFQEGIIDLSGPGARYSTLSRLVLIVVEAEVAAGVGPYEHERALRTAGLAAARWLAGACARGEPTARETSGWEPLPAGTGLPRVAHVNVVLAQGLLHDTYVLGRDAKSGLPRSVDPRIYADTAVVSGNCVSACDKNTTYHYQNHPVIEALMRMHGSRLDFAGVVITPAATRLEEKERAARACAARVTALGVGGAVVSKEGFGNPDTDLMMITRLLEAAGVAVVGITDEFAGADGASQSLADTAREADAIISTGNANERIVLPAMARTFGPLPDVARLTGGYPYSLRADGTLEVEIQALIGATNELGFERLSARDI